MPLAVGALFECQRRSVAVPERVATRRFRRHCHRSQVVPALTTLRVPRYAIGQRAGAMICDRLNGGAVFGGVLVDAGFELVTRDGA